MLATEKTLLFDPRLHPLASTIRTLLFQRGPKSLAALALLAGLNAEPASAATINVNASCTLIDAITAANTDTAAGNCSAGSGADTIVLPAKSMQNLTVANNSSNGLPVITSQITIAGNGSTIKRDTPTLLFRIFEVGSGGNLTLNSTTVSGGSLLSGCGSGLLNKGSLTLNNSTVSGNSASYAGAGLCNSFAILTLNNSTVSANSAGQYGGGLMNTSGTLILNNSTVSGNSSGLFGGGVENRSTLAVAHSTISNNTALTGGGIDSTIATLTVANSTVSGNIASSSAGGGGVYTLSGLATFSRSLISGNTASEGAEIKSASTAIFVNDHNLFGHDSDAGVSGFVPGATDILSTQALNAILAPLAANGGSTQTHLLVKGSPAINASPNDAKCSPKRDQRGISRPQGSACDIGATEVTFCDTATPTTGCTVNGLPNRSCQGTDAADTIVGTSGNDIIRGLGGNDILKGSGGNDKLCGGAGNDRLEGGIGLDQLFGGSGSDRLLGGDGDDSLSGEQENDNLDGGLGADKLNGGPGSKDTCTNDAGDASVIGCEL